MLKARAVKDRETGENATFTNVASSKVTLNENGVVSLHTCPSQRGTCIHGGSAPCRRNALSSCRVRLKAANVAVLTAKDSARPSRR